MKKDIHPNFRKVVFKDISSETSFLTDSTVNTKETIQWEDGKEYPLFKTEISSASHPFYTGTQKVLDTEGRIDRFNKRYAKFTK
jgi:large subunit ribosomal protein L31